MYTIMLLVILQQDGMEPKTFKTSWQVPKMATCFNIAQKYFNKTVPYDLGGTITFNGYCYKPIDDINRG